jgi:hypothetical protein
VRDKGLHTNHIKAWGSGRRQLQRRDSNCMASLLVPSSFQPKAQNRDPAWPVPYQPTAVFLDA